MEVLSGVKMIPGMTWNTCTSNLFL